MTLTMPQIAQAAYQAGFRGQGLTWMTAIAMRESGGNPDAYNGNTKTGDNSWGLWQINTLGGNSAGIARIMSDLGYPANFELLKNPLVNAQVAYKLSSGGTNFEPWRSHSPGWEGPQGFLTNATQYLPAAAAASLRTQLAPASQQTTLMRNVAQAQGNPSTYATLTSWLNGQLGKPYQFASKGPNTYDCSGLTAAAYEQLGIHMDALTWSQAKYGVDVPNDPNSLQPGDLFLAHGAQGDLGHVGIYIGGGMVEDAPHTGAVVRVQPVSAWNPQTIRRVIDSTGALIVGAGITPPHDPSVRTVQASQAVYNTAGSTAQIGMPDYSGIFSTPNGQTASTQVAPSDFTLPAHDFVLPGYGARTPQRETVFA